MLCAVFPAAFRIVDTAVSIHIHRVYSKVSSSDVFFDRCLENNFVRPSEVRIRSVFPESRNFDIAFVRHSRNGSVLCCIVVEIDPCFSEYLYSLFRLCRSRHIVIVRHVAQNDVAYGTAGNIGLKAFFNDQFKYPSDIAGDPVLFRKNIIHILIITRAASWLLYLNGAGAITTRIVIFLK